MKLCDLGNISKLPPLMQTAEGWSCVWERVWTPEETVDRSDIVQAVHDPLY